MNALASELQALADAMPNRVRQAQMRQSAGSPLMGPPSPFQAALPPSDYGMSCVLCGGTPTGESHRGFVGRCTCRSNAMSFDFTDNDGRVFHLDTEGGEVHCAEVAPRAELAQSLEPEDAE